MEGSLLSVTADQQWISLDMKTFEQFAASLKA
jgi:hypothetical protein